MEVHHHAHHEGKKNWKSYIWEFLMLFLAVFCGFLAEWQLEHTIEHQREKEYIKSMVEDIKEDVTQSARLIDLVSDRKLKVDSLLDEISSGRVVKNSNKTYQLWKSTIGFPDFIHHDRTIQQLKSSGSLRLIRIKAVSDTIMKYDQLVRQIDVTQGNMNAILLNQNIYQQFFDFIKLQNNPSTPIPLTPKGVNLLNEAYAERTFWQLNLTGLLKRLKLINSEGQNVVKFIEKEYQLD